VTDRGLSTSPMRLGTASISPRTPYKSLFS
jgi:hypothetical protein